MPRSVCLICRHRLATQAASKTSQWRAQSSFWSGTGDVGATADRERPQSDDGSRIAGGERGARQQRPHIRRVVQEEKLAKPRTNSTKPRRRTATQAAQADADMADLFRQIVDRPNSEVTAIDAANAESMNIRLVHDIGRLQDLLDAKAPLPEAFKFLQTVLYPSIKQNGITVPKVFQTVVSSLMHEILNAKKHDIMDPDLPSVADMFRVFADLGDLNPADWLILTGELVRYLCEMKTSADDYPSIEAFEDHLATKNRVILDLVESWKILSLPRSRASGGPNHDGNKILDGFWLPRLDKTAINKHARSKKFSAALSSLFPQYAPNQLGDRFAVLAIATLTLLIDDARSNTSSRRSASRFISKVAQLVDLTGVDEKALRTAIAVTYPPLEKYIMGQWPKLAEHTAGRNATADGSGDLDSLAVPRVARRPHDTAFFEKRLSQAYGQRNSTEVNRLWQELVGVGPEIRPAKATKLQQSPNIFDSFINTYMALNKPDRAIEVWNTLPKFGLKPTLKTWNVMLDGCKKASNLKGLKTVWQRLLDSGARLDVPIWTTRVAGLMECGDASGAIMALEEMNTLWHQAQGKKSAHAVPPAIEPVNAALSGLIRMNNHTAAQRLLAWAKDHNITPDIFTFNLLLRPLILDGRDKEVEAIFRNMEAVGVTADAATFTVMLEGTLTRLDAWDLQSQVDVVAAVFRDMEKAGVETNHQTYGKMIHLLLRSGDRAQESVKAVLEHLWEQGLELSPHIYTTLVEHYFSRHPPDLKTVNELIEKRRLLDYDDMDRIFYDRVIKGYAAAGDPETAHGIYLKLSSAGFLVSLDAQYELLRSLMLVGKRDDAQCVVEDTVKKYAEQHGEDGWHGHRFWHLAERSLFIDWVPDARGGKAVIQAPAQNTM